MMTTIQYATWNPADSLGTLSNDNLTASNLTAGASTRATVGVSSGKWYWEIKPNGPVNHHIVGIGTLNTPISGYVGQAGLSIGYAGNDGYNPNTSGFTYYGNSRSPNTGAYSDTDILGFALDIDSRGLYIYKNGVLVISEALFFVDNPNTTAFYPMACSDSYAYVASVTANFGATPFAYPVPNGFNAGIYIERQVLATDSDPYFENVKLLLHGEGADGQSIITDDGYNNLQPFSTGSVVTSNAQSKFGSSSLFFTGGQPLRYVDSNDWNLTSPTLWTMEMFFFETPNSYGSLISRRIPGSTAGWVLTTDGVRANINGLWSDNQQNWVRPAFNQWHHMAWVRNVAKLTLFIDGLPVNIKTGVNTIYDNGGHLVFGQADSQLDNGENKFRGYISEFRFISGIARYTSAFVPPETAFSSTLMVTSTPTSTVTDTPAPTPTTTQPTDAPTSTPTLTPTNTPTPTPTNTPTPTPTSTETPTPTFVDDYPNINSLAFPIDLNSSTQGEIQYAGDLDIFKLTVVEPGNLEVYTTGDTDTYGVLLDEFDTIIDEVDDYDGYINFHIFYLATPGVYYIHVRHYDQTATTGFYTLVSTFTPTSTVTPIKTSAPTSTPTATPAPTLTVTPTVTIRNKNFQSILDNNNAITETGEIRLFFQLNKLLITGQTLSVTRKIGIASRVRLIPVVGINPLQYEINDTVPVNSYSTETLITYEIGIMIQDVLLYPVSRAVRLSKPTVTPAPTVTPTVIALQ